MPQFDNINAVRRTKTYRLLGSFWNSVFSDRDKVKILLDLDFRNQLIPDFHAAVDNLAGNADMGRRVSFLELTFRPSEVFQAGMLVYDDPDRKVNYGTEFDSTVIFDSSRIKYYVVPFRNYIPIKIQAKDKTLILGIDFFAQAKQWLYFRDDPRLMFPSGVLPVIEGWAVNYHSYISYLTRVQTNGNDDLVVDWLRNLQTNQSFKLAVAAVAQLGIVREGGQLESLVTTSTGEIIYAFPNEVVRAAYRHTPLQVGQIYPPNTVIGDVIQIFGPQDKKIAWWRQLDWKGGLVLDPILPGFNNIPLADIETVAYTAGQDVGSINGSKVHARLVLSNDFNSEVVYWDAVQKNETALGIYLNTLLKLPEEVDSGNPLASDTFEKLIANWRLNNDFNTRLHFDPEQPSFRTLPTAKLVNALDTFFQAYLGDAAMAIVLDLSRLINPLDVMSFIRREAPAGSTLIIIGFLSSTPTDAVEVGVNVLVNDFVALQQVAPESVSDTYFLASLISDYVEVTPIFPES